MKADRVEVSRDDSGKQWLIRIQVGEEVIRRHAPEPKDATQDALRNVAVRIANEEGYEFDPSAVVFS
jgi:hypothetical protein